MAVTIRQADIEELHSVNARIEEFRTPYPIEVFQERLASRRWYGLVAEDAGELLGFKLGYELGKGVFYNMLMLLLSEGYQVFDIEPQEQLEDNRIWFRKALTS